MRRATAAAAPIPVSTMTTDPAIAAISVGHPLRNALLRSRSANISLAASPPPARRMAEPTTAAHPTTPPGRRSSRRPGVKVVLELPRSCGHGVSVVQAARAAA
jgi:hypothetical protein